MGSVRRTLLLLSKTSCWEVGLRNCNRSLCSVSILFAEWCGVNRVFQNLMLAKNYHVSIIIHVENNCDHLNALKLLIFSFQGVQQHYYGSKTTKKLLSVREKMFSPSLLIHSPSHPMTACNDNQWVTYLISLRAAHLITLLSGYDEVEEINKAVRQRVREEGRKDNDEE